ncbi:MAG: hypothetical protein KC636_33090, partial [Myxococcales bacterium]|nr:hypothetical protein [Myxococcales bacterium]
MEINAGHGRTRTISAKRARPRLREDRRDRIDAPDAGIEDFDFPAASASTTVAPPAHDRACRPPSGRGRRLPGLHGDLSRSDVMPRRAKATARKQTAKKRASKQQPAKKTA